MEIHLLETIEIIKIGRSDDPRLRADQDRPLVPAGHPIQTLQNQGNHRTIRDRQRLRHSCEGRDQEPRPPGRGSRRKNTHNTRYTRHGDADRDSTFLRAQGCHGQTTGKILMSQLAALE